MISPYKLGISPYSNRQQIGYVNSKYIEFGGTDEDINIGNAPFNFGTGDYSISFWVYVSSTGGSIYFMGRFTDVPNRVYLYIISSGELRFTINVGGTTVTSSGTNAINYDTWNHIVIVGDRDTGTTFYTNGTKESGLPIHNGTVNITAAGTCYLGRYSTNYMTGRMDDVVIYSKALTDSDVALLRGGGTPQTAGDPTKISGIKAYWNFENDIITGINDIADVSGNGYTGTSENMESADIKTY